MNKVKPALGGIYKIEVEGIGTYYGESDNIPRRWATHRKQLNNGRHHCYKLKRAYQELGPKKFKFTVIEQSRELTDSKQLRKMKEQLLILSDPMNLNTAASTVDSITATSLPNKDIYRNKVVYIERQGKAGMAKVRHLKHDGTLLGIETIEGKFRAGLFQSDENCNLTRVQGYFSANNQRKRSGN